LTCIVGIVEGGKVYIGGDSAGVAGYYLQSRADQKVFTNGPFVFGFTSSFRMGQILRYGFTPPQRHPDTDVMAFMVTAFIDAIRNTFKNAGYAKKTNDQEEAGTFLVGYEGRLFKISDDYQVGESLDQYDACGCGQDIALGSLHSTGGMDPERRIEIALTAAEKYSAGVRAPFNVVQG
jgi:hypothetical protein